MAPKRKSDVELEKENDGFASSIPAAKKARVIVDASNSDASSSTAKGKGKSTDEITDWRDVKLKGEDEGEVPVYDDCNEVRRKIRLLQKEPGFKVTHWLRDIGGVNSNSLSRFMKVSGPTAGAENGTYVAAYKYFEKIRISINKKKTPKRIKNEETHPSGLPLRDRKHVWVLARP
ncbi:hypothetical protein JB92DRAFT_2786864 [Gautieria morchelliformis]|nr:hypothetical protein JB92DRAFT_2786864 [Gautieria morchelliformis]